MKERGNKKIKKKMSKTNKIIIINYYKINANKV